MRVLKRQPSRRAWQRGLTLVELMVGITIGLIIAAGASMMAVNQIGEHRRISVEVQMQQDLRLIADMVALQIRRAGFRGWSELGVWAPESAGSAATPAMESSANPFEGLASSDSDRTLTFAYESSPETGEPRAKAVAYVDEVNDADQGGFKIEDGELKMQLGRGNWQPISDKGSYRFDPAKSGFKISTQSQSLEEFCDLPCNGLADCPPQQEIRTVTITLVATSELLKDVTRTIQIEERVRSDKITGTCARS